MLQFDATKWRALGLDAELTALLVACVNAANRAPKPGAAGRGIQSMTVDTDGGLRVVMTDRSEIALGGLRVQLSDVDTAAIIASATGEVLDALPVTVVDLDIEGGRLIKVMSDGTRAPGPLLPVGPVDPDPEAAPALSGGALDLVDGDLVLVPPTVTAGQPDPQLVLTSLTRDGADVLDEVEDGRIADAAPGVYEAVWTASNGVDPDATAVASLTIAAPAQPTIVVSPENILRIDNLTGPTPLTVTAPDRYAGAYAPGAADLETGPQPLADIVLRTVSGAPAAVGQSLVLDLGPWESQHPQVQIASIRYRAGDTILGTASTLAITSALAGQSIVADYALSDASGATEGTTPAVAVPGTTLASGATRIGFYAQDRAGATGAQRLLDIDLGPADPAKRMLMLVSTRGDYSPTFAIIAGGVEYPLEVVASAGPASNSAGVHLLEASIPAGGAAVLRATYTGNTAPGLAAEILALKGMSRQTLVAGARIAMTAGTPVSVQVATQAGDLCVLALVATPTAAGGIIDAAAGVTEVIDRTLSTASGQSPWQFWIGAATDATGSATRTLSATPNVSGNAGRLAAVYRRS